MGPSGKNVGAVALVEWTHGWTKVGKKQIQSEKAGCCAGGLVMVAVAGKAADGSSSGGRESTGYAVTSMWKRENLA